MYVQLLDMMTSIKDIVSNLATTVHDLSAAVQGLSTRTTLLESSLNKGNEGCKCIHNFSYANVTAKTRLLHLLMQDI